MSGSTERVYWDTCIFYTLLNSEADHGDGILDSVAEEFESFQKGRIQLLTSTITIAEVAAGRFDDPAQFQMFRNLKFMPGFEFAAPIIPIMELSSELKDYYYNNPLGDSGQYKQLNIADAIHLATAIKRDCTKFVTLDGRNKDPKGKAEIGLLKLKNLLAGKYHLNICRPTPPAQVNLPL